MTCFGQNSSRIKWLTMPHADDMIHLNDVPNPASLLELWCILLVDGSMTFPPPMSQEAEADLIV